MNEISSTSNTSMPFRRFALSLVGERLGNPEAALFADDHQLHAFGPARRSRGRAGRSTGLPRVTRAVEHLAVGRPAGVVDGDQVVCARDASLPVPGFTTLDASPRRSSRRRRAALPRRAARESAAEVASAPQRRDRSSVSASIADAHAMSPFSGSIVLQLCGSQRLAIAVSCSSFELLLERFELLAGFAELAFGRQALIVGEVAGGVAR